MRYFLLLFFWFSFFFSSFAFANEDMNIIPRAWWGADESLRYGDNPIIQKYYEANLQYFQSSKTPSQILQIQTEANRIKYIQEKNWPAWEVVERRYYEDGHPLFLPLEKTKQVSRIILHHEWVVLGTDSDEEIIRKIYKIHTLKWWGDIAYHYIIWQRGQIYEWRAWWDYVVGTHALSNNLWSVGIVILWNYTENHLNADQIVWLKKLISYLARKYGITLSADAFWFECEDSNCNNLKTVITKSFLGHRDVKSTNCPGDNVYPLISEWIKELDVRYTPIYNMNHFIEDIPVNRVMNMTLNTVSSTINTGVKIPIGVQIPQKVNYIWPKIGVKLSYPEKDSIVLSSLTKGIVYVFVWTKKIPLQYWKNIEVWKIWKSILSVRIGNRVFKTNNFKITGTVLRIDSWARNPAWDTKKIYNDNLFRDTLSITNQDGKFVVVNHLPLEWYLKWLWEVSNGDPQEKIKTIVVAARSYARYYMDPKNRKYATRLYDASDDPDSFQKYLGYSYESRSPSVWKMVDATKWEIILYNSGAIKPWYFSSSDGKTLSYKEYCEKNTGKICEDIPYLHAVDDPGAVWMNRFGHGVGISGIWATYFANQWWDYKKIIQYYLTGVEISKK